MRWGSGYGGGYGEYVPVAKRKAQAKSFAEKRAMKQGRKPEPVEIQGTKIAKTFWGKAWCDHLESFSDYANRLPRGRTYARNGSVADLVISAGRIEAIVGGSDVYEINIRITKLKAGLWKNIRYDCSASIDSLLDLLAGRFSDGVMERLTDQTQGLFPSPKEIVMDCSCPDGARLCKHLAAVLYGVGAHLDKNPQLLFVLRDVDHAALVNDAVSGENLNAALGQTSSDLDGEDLGAMFGIELAAPPTANTATKAESRTKANKKSSKKKSAEKAKQKRTTAKSKPTKAGAPKTQASKKKATVKKKSVTKKTTTRSTNTAAKKKAKVGRKKSKAKAK